ncbi:hypothetical protein DIPPA_23067 [Diplonema papillatum]|nr:hypothetical protein DIPPA_23067 [Diplonema papillatum]
MNKSLELLIYVLTGGVLGLLMIWLVGSALEEITVNKVVSIVFGVVLFLLSAMLLYRVYTADLDFSMAVSTIMGAVLIAGSGVVSLMFDPDIVGDLSKSERVPMYALLGLSFSFAFVYLVMDLMLMGVFNCGGCLRKGADRGQSFVGVSTLFQVYATVGGSILVGLVYGLIFGLFDLEETRHAKYRRWALLVGFVGGAMVAGVFWKSSEDEDNWSELDEDNDPYDHDHEGTDGQPMDIEII